MLYELQHGHGELQESIIRDDNVEEKTGDQEK